MTKETKWGIRVNGDTWMTDGHWMDENGDWQDIPALYDTAREAKQDAKWFSETSNHKYVAEVYTKNQN